MAGKSLRMRSQFALHIPSYGPLHCLKGAIFIYCVIHNSERCACNKPRVIKTCQDAKQILASERASAEEWRECANILIECNEPEAAADCIVFAVETIRSSHINSSELHRLIGDYLGLRAERLGSWSNAKSFLWKLFEDLDQRQKTAKADGNARFASHLDSEIAELLMLASDSSKYARVRLAAKLRKPKPAEKRIRWNRPNLALRIINEVLAANAGDKFALNTRAAVHMDMGNLGDALEDGLASLRLDDNDPSTHAIVASIYLAMHEIDRAWEHACRAFDLKPSPIGAAQVWLCFSFYARDNEVPPNFVDLDEVRTWLGTFSDTPESMTPVQIALIKLLCNRAEFLYALQSLAEFHREEWLGVTAYWDAFIRREAWAHDRKIRLPDLDSLINNPEDFFPDNIK